MSTEKRKRTGVLKIDAVELPRFSGFIGHRHVQNAGAEYTGYHKLRYYVFLFLVDIAIYDSTIFG